MSPYLAVLWLSLAGCFQERKEEPVEAVVVDGPLLATQHPDPWEGEQRALVLLVEWSDEPAPVSVESLQEDFFGGKGSLAGWFAEASAGKFRLTGEVLPWRKSEREWNTQGLRAPTDIAKLALELFGGAFDRSDFDATGNGRIDHLFVVHSGRIARDRVGPRWVFGSGSADRTVVLQSRGLGSVGEDLAIGFYVHEAGHRYFGLRDRYGEHANGNYGIGVWGLMGLGQWGPSAKIPLAALNRNPVHPRARAKMRIGWAETRVLTGSARDVVLNPVEVSGDVIRLASGGEYDLVLEVRSPQGFHTDLPGHGLLVWREPKILAGAVDLLSADGRDDLSQGTVLGERPLPPNDENFGDDSDPFPGSLKVEEVTDPVTGIRIYDIRHKGPAVQFNVDFPAPSQAVSTP